MSRSVDILLTTVLIPTSPLMNKLAPALGLITGLLLASSVAAQPVYRCNGPNSQAVFQQSPCGGDSAGKQIVLNSNVMESNPAGDRGLRLQAERDQRIRRLVGAGQIATGMTESELVAAWGRATSINTDLYAGGKTSKQWIYQRAGGNTQYVYTDGTYVTAIQDRPSTPRIEASRCYSPTEIRNEQVSASSITVDSNQQREMRKKIDRMRPC